MHEPSDIDQTLNPMLDDELSAPSDFVSRMRHTTSHVLAQAMRKLMPTAKMGIGPVTLNPQNLV